MHADVSRRLYGSSRAPACSTAAHSARTSSERRAPGDDRGALAGAVGELRAGEEDVAGSDDVRLDAAVQVIQRLAVRPAFGPVAEADGVRRRGRGQLEPGASSTRRASSCASSQQPLTSSTMPSRPSCFSAAQIDAPRHERLASMPSSCRLTPAPGCQVRGAPGERLAVQLGVPEQHEADAVRHVQPLVAIDRQRVGALDACDERRRGWPQAEERAERAVDVEPEAVRSRTRRRSRRSGRTRRC